MLHSIMNRINAIININRLKRYWIPVFIFLMLTSLSFATYYFQSEREVANLHKIMESHGALFPMTLLISGLLFSLLVALIIHNSLSAQARTQALAKANYLSNLIIQSTDRLINKDLHKSF